VAALVHSSDMVEDFELCWGILTCGGALVHPVHRQVGGATQATVQLGAGQWVRDQNSPVVQSEQEQRTWSGCRFMGSVVEASWARQLGRSC
jgi:hypothetical protein